MWHKQHKEPPNCSLPSAFNDRNLQLLLPTARCLQVPGLSPQSPWNQKSLDIKYPPLKEVSARHSCSVTGVAGWTCQPLS